mmetsp:Transcript_6114/g.13445  ORF Transcript_6114/g.13445 Transcript_6114/m.13445 type:complete len:181 (-) Transcript_6114:235-777(-)
MFPSILIVSVRKDKSLEVRSKFLINVPSATVMDDDNDDYHTFVAEAKDAKEVTSNNGYHNFASRDEILHPDLNYLVDGNLTVDVSIRTETNEVKLWAPSNPKESVANDILKLLDSADDDTADVLFEVRKNKRKKVKFYAHSHVLKARAPVLAALAEDCDATTPIPLENFDPDTELFERCK